MTSKHASKNKQAFGDTIRYFREKSGMKQMELATVMERDRQFVFDYESGKRMANLDLVLEFSEALKVSPTDFVQEYLNRRNQNI